MLNDKLSLLDFMAILLGCANCFNVVWNKQQRDSLINFKKSFTFNLQPLVFNGKFVRREA